MRIKINNVLKVKSINVKYSLINVPGKSLRQTMYKCYTSKVYLNITRMV